MLTVVLTIVLKIHETDRVSKAGHVRHARCKARGLAMMPFVVRLAREDRGM